MNSGDEEEEEEVTFLLRLRPTPSPPAPRRQKSSIGNSRPVSGSGWDVVVERQESTPPPNHKTGVQSRPTSGTAWGATSQSLVAPSAPPSSEVLRPWVCPTPHHAWAAPYGPPFPNVTWTSSQHGLDYRYSDSAIIPQTVSVEEDYRRHFQTPDMFFHSLSVDKTNFYLPNNLPLHPYPQNPTHAYKHQSEDLYQRRTLPDPKGDSTHKKSYSVDNGSICDTSSTRDPVRSVSMSHGNLSVTNQNVSSSDQSVPPREGFGSVSSDIRSDTPKEPNKNALVSSGCQKNDCFNSSHSYFSPRGTFARALSMDQIHRCGASETLNQESSDGKGDRIPPALPPRPPKPARFRRDEHRRSQPLQGTMSWVRIKTDLPHFVVGVHVRAAFQLEANQDQIIMY